MKIVIATSTEAIEAAGLLNVNAKRRKRYKKDMSAKGVKERREAAIYRRKNKAKLERNRKRYYQRNKTRLAQRAKKLASMPKAPVMQRAQASVQTGVKVFRNSTTAAGPKVTGQNPACMKVIDTLAKVCKVSPAVIKADIFGDDGYTVGQDCYIGINFIKSMKLKRERDGAYSAEVCPGWTLRGRMGYHEEGVFTFWLTQSP